MGAPGVVEVRGAMLLLTMEKNRPDSVQLRDRSRESKEPGRRLQQYSDGK